MKALGRQLNALLARTGFRLQSLSDTPSIVDVRARGNDPRSIFYHSRYTPVLIDAPLSSGRGLLSFPLAPGGCHPFVYAVSCALQTSKPEQSLRQSLGRYYAEVRPRSAAEYLGLAETCSPRLAQIPPWAFVFPWVTQPPEERLARKTARKAILPPQHRSADVPAAFGWKDCGPATPELLENEVRRLSRLMDSVDRNGPTRHNGAGGDILAVAMVNPDGAWRWRVGAGHHRAAVISAFGYRSVPVRIVAVVSRCDASLWPGVQAGLYSEAAALTVFDNVFEGNLPPVFSAWQECARRDRAVTKRVPVGTRVLEPNAT